MRRPVTLDSAVVSQRDGRCADPLAARLPPDRERRGRPRAFRGCGCGVCRDRCPMRPTPMTTPFRDPDHRAARLGEARLRRGGGEARPRRAGASPLVGEVDVAAVARTLLRLVGGFRKEARLPGSFERLLRNHAEGLDPLLVATLRADRATRREDTETQGVEALQALAEAHPERPEPLRALAAHLEVRKGAFAEAARAFGEAHRRSQEAQDAFDAARVIDRLEPEAAWEWIRRIPEAERERFPQIVLYEAKAALRSGERGEAVRDAYEALSALQGYGRRPRGGGCERGDGRARRGRRRSARSPGVSRGRPSRARRQRAAMGEEGQQCSPGEAAGRGGGVVVES